MSIRRCLMYPAFILLFRYFRMYIHRPAASFRFSFDEPCAHLLFIFYLQTFVNGSGREGGVGQPFGYIKASTNLLSVNFFVMPYNYPVLLPLLGKS